MTHVPGNFIGQVLSLRGRFLPAWSKLLFPHLRIRLVSFLTIFLTILYLSATWPACAQTYHLLAIGIEDYDKPDYFSSLAGASADAYAIAATFRAFSNTDPKNIEVLTTGNNLHPTKDNIIAALDRLKARVGSGDIAFVYFSCHGVAIDGKSYLIPCDVPDNKLETLTEHGITATTVRDKLASVQARAVVLAYDMCRKVKVAAKDGTGSPGVTLASPKAKDIILVDNDDPDQPQPQAAVTLFSCRLKQKSYMYDAKGRSYFGYFLERALRGDQDAGAGSDGIVRITDLLNRLPDKVAGIVKANEHRDQEPDQYSFGNLSNVVLTRPGSRPSDILGKLLSNAAWSEDSCDLGLHFPESDVDSNNNDKVVPAELIDQLREWRHNGERIESVSVAPDKSWIALSDKHYEAHNVDKSWADIIDPNQKQYGEFRFATPAPGGGWIWLFGNRAIYPETFEKGTMIQQQFVESINKLVTDGKHIEFVSFTADGSYIICWDRNGLTYSNGIPQSLIDKSAEMKKGDANPQFRNILFDAQGHWTIFFDENGLTFEQEFDDAYNPLLWACSWQRTLGRRIDAVAITPGNGWVMVTGP